MKTPRSLVHSHSGADWVAKEFKVTPSPFGCVVADLLGLVYGGIYHLPCGSLGKVDWTDDRFISVSVNSDLATFDYNILTNLVILAHDLAVRVSIDNGGPRRMRLSFHPRERTGSMSQRHPTLEDAVTALRSAYRVEFAGMVPSTEST